MNILKYTAFALVLIGALNWGLIGLFNFDLVAALFGDMTILSRIVYSLVGISAIITGATIHKCEITEKNESCEYGHCH